VCAGSNGAIHVNFYDDESNATPERVPSVNMLLAREPATERASRAILSMADHLVRGAAHGSTTKYKIALGATVADLLKAAAYAPHRPCYRPLAIAAFKGQRVGYRPFKSVLGDLERHHFARVARGSTDPGCARSKQGVVTRIYPTQKLVDFLAAWGVSPDGHAADFKRVKGSLVVPEPIQLVAASTFTTKRVKVKGRRLPVEISDPKVKQLAEPILALNTYWENQTLHGAEHDGFFRRFNLGDHPDFRWNMGGRLYSLGGEYQHMPKRLRPFMLINGEPTVEIDIRASHLTILHALSGTPLPDGDDPYEIPGLPRPIAKAWVTMTLGHDRFHSRWSDDQRKGEEILELCKGKPLQKAYPIRNVQNIVLNHIPMLKEWPSNPINWADLQYVEGEVILDTICKLMKLDIPALPIFDSIIVRKSDLEESIRYFSSSFREIVGVYPKLKTK